MKKSRIIISLVVVLLSLSACSAPATTQFLPATESVPVQPPPTAIFSPTPVPDTPAPAAINAPIVEAPSLVTIHFLNELDGWGVTNTQILRTNDGGVTWYNVTPPNVTQTGNSVNIFVLDNKHVWMQVPDMANYPNAGTLYRTSDAGATWISVATPFSGANMTFLDNDNGWVLADLGAGAGSEGVAVFQTTDGGATWNQTYTNDPNDPKAGESLPLGGIKSGLTPLNMQTAWVTGIVYSDGTVYVYRTDDGGKTWSPLTSVPLPPGAETLQLNWNPIVFVSPQAAYMTLNVPSEQPSLAVYTSTDAGNTWSLTPTLIPKAIASNFLSATEAVIYNGEQFYVTHDAAQTWSTVPDDPAFRDTFIMMDFVSTSTGWVITSDSNSHRSLYRTSDGGTTWSLVIP